MYTTGDTERIDNDVQALAPHTHTHTHVNMGALIFFTAAMIRAFRSARSRGTNTLHSNHRLNSCDILTQNAFSPGAAIFSLHTLASRSGRNVNYNDKQLTGKKNV